VGRHSRSHRRGTHRADNRWTTRAALALALLVVLALGLWVSNGSSTTDTAAPYGASTVAPTTEAPTVTAPPAESLAETAPTVTVTVSPAAFPDCDAAKAAGVSMIPQGDPRYVAALDHDGDGWACDRHGDPITPPPPVPVCVTPER